MTQLAKKLSTPMYPWTRKSDRVNLLFRVRAFEFWIWPFATKSWV